MWLTQQSGLPRFPSCSVLSTRTASFNPKKLQPLSSSIVHYRLYSTIISHSDIKMTPQQEEAFRKIKEEAEEETEHLVKPEDEHTLEGIEREEDNEMDEEVEEPEDKQTDEKEPGNMEDEENEGTTKLTADEKITRKRKKIKNLGNYIKFMKERM